MLYHFVCHPHPMDQEDFRLVPITIFVDLHLLFPLVLSMHIASRYYLLFNANNSVEYLLTVWLVLANLCL